MILKNFNFKIALKLFLLMILGVTIDQCTKVFVSNLMILNNFSNINIFPFLDIVFVRNTGISFGMFSDGGTLGRYFFSSFSIIVGSFLIILSILSKKKIVCIGLCLISSGAIGNAIDRIYFGGVIDFIDIFVYNFHWPAFNFADIFITVGVILLLTDNIVYSKHEN